jgi:hypothetical protein
VIALHEIGAMNPNRFSSCGLAPQYTLAKSAAQYDQVALERFLAALFKKKRNCLVVPSTQCVRFVCKVFGVDTFFRPGLKQGVSTVGLKLQRCLRRTC